jgi:hypothetical protein
MDCSGCKLEYNYSEIIPLACKCGHTLCRACTLLNSKDDVFTCPKCSQKSKMDEIWLNRGLDVFIKEIKDLKIFNQKTRKTNHKVFRSGSPLLAAISSDTQYQALDNCEVVYVENKETLVVPDSKNIQTQTVGNCIMMKKISEKKLCTEIVWNKCGLLVLYTIFALPWVLDI